MNILYISMNRREKMLGWPWLICCALVMPALFYLWSSPLSFCLEAAIGCTGAVLIFHSFLRASVRVPHTTPAQILLKALLGLIISFVTTIVMNDLFFFYMPQFFSYTDYGPMYYNVNEAAFVAIARECFPLTALAFVVLMPVTEELLFRGLLFGSLFRWNRMLAYVVSVSVFAFLPTIGLIGHYPAMYIVLNFLQYVPLGLILGWVYTSTETIITPIVLRMVLHALAICVMR